MRRLGISTLLLLAASTLAAQRAPDVPSQPPLGQLDPTRSIAQPQLFSSFHQPLPEQYIWTHDPDHLARAERDAPRYFRVHFHLDAAPENASLYLAGPRGARVFINGAPAAHLEADPLSRIQMTVFVADIARYLHAGDNLLAIVADQGETMVAKIIPAPFGIIVPPFSSAAPAGKPPATLLTTGTPSPSTTAPGPTPTLPAPSKATSTSSSGIATPASINGLAMTASPPSLRAPSFPLQRSAISTSAVAARTTTPTRSHHRDQNPAHEFTVRMDPNRAPMDFVPSITLDFGREVTGRIQVLSDTDAPITVSVAYGESIEEAHNEPYLGVDAFHISPRGAAAGPKSAFRYAQIRFLAGPAVLKFRAIRLEDIYYPVQYQGSFESSDPLLNRIWETGAYTSHLCMQDDIWDAPKRDRGRWMGDTDVSGRVIDDVFADHFLLEDTLTRLIGPLPIQEPVNGIPGYSSYWFTELKHYDLHTGRKEYVASMHDQIVGLLQFMDKDFDANGNFINHSKKWLYVDWALDLNGDTPQTRIATTFEYIRAYRAGAWLLRQIGDTANADHFEQRADQLAQHSQGAYFADGSFGPRWQTNAMAVISGTAKPDQYSTIWSNVLTTLGKPTYRPDIVSPYYGSYVLDALARMDHRADALKWIRTYWGGMIHEGATSFWEAYDPSWPKDDPHVDLQADDTAGYRISLAHGWSSAPTWWLMEQVLGIVPTGPRIQPGHHPPRPSRPRLGPRR